MSGDNEPVTIPFAGKEQKTAKQATPPPQPDAEPRTWQLPAHATQQEIVRKDTTWWLTVTTADGVREWQVDVTAAVGQAVQHVLATGQVDLKGCQDALRASHAVSARLEEAAKAAQAKFNEGQERILALEAQNERAKRWIRNELTKRQAPKTTEG